ncbi:MAG TPA: ribonuclease E inhibitor B, partial [Pseudoalteromonas sp.]|nr:ribonuclease E inhibitor B [Pseudoalteromonas sp.]
VVVECELDVEAIMEDVDKLEALAQQTDVEYDGWGTYFQE